MTRAYYNENDPVAAHALRHLIACGVIVPGDVDDRSIKDVNPDDLSGYAQCHFFAGFGGWSVAARLAGWPDERPLWTGSCPCQPFSVAGKGGGTADARHLWPDLFRLIRSGRPTVVVGEQVAGAAGYGWFNGVAADLEGEGYACRAVDIPACAVDAPHIRQRLYWVAVADAGRELGRPEHELRGGRPAPAGADASGITLGDAVLARLEGQRGHGDGAGGWPLEAGSASAPDGRNGVYAAADRGGCAGWTEASERGALERTIAERDLPRRNGSHWAESYWLPCHDGKARRAKPGIRLLVDGMPGRIGAWRLAGNGIVPPLGAEVLAALSDVLPEWRGRA